MLSLKKYQNRKIAIYGMGKSGYSTAKKLKALKAKIYCWDDNKKIRERLKRSNFNVKKFWLNNKQNSTDHIVISPGIDISKCKIRNYLKKNFSKIITDLDIFFELNKNQKIISITGTNGKSTTCKIIEKILKTAGYKPYVCGNIGKPVLSINTSRKKNIFILEVSSYQLQYSKLFRSNHAAILNISPDHLERHKNIKNYIKIKTKIFLSQKFSDYSYINLPNKYSKFIINIFKKKKIKSKLIKIKKNNFKFLLKKINNNYLESKGNIENFSFACKIVKNLGVSDKAIIKAANQFKGLPHRQEIIFFNKDIICINDSKATSFDSSYQSLSNYSNIYWIVGGLPKFKDNFYLTKVSKKIIKAYIIGRNINFFKNKIKKKIPYKISYDLKNAISNILQDIKKNKMSKNTILLSPAAASFDQFSNFEERGVCFKRLIIKEIRKY